MWPLQMTPSRSQAGPLGPALGAQPRGVCPYPGISEASEVCTLLGREGRGGTPVATGYTALDREGWTCISDSSCRKIARGRCYLLAVGSGVGATHMAC